jgi:transposase InsO family protein
MEWVETLGISIRHIQPGKPQQNAYIERYNRTVRHEWLDQHIFDPIEKAQDFATQSLWACSNDRPNICIGGMIPAQKLNAAALILRPNPVENGRITRRGLAPAGAVSISATAVSTSSNASCRSSAVSFSDFRP